MNCLDNPHVKPSGASEVAFPPASRALEAFGLKFSPGGPHISRTMMLAELSATLANVPQGSDSTAYRDAILERNVLGKSTDSTRRESLRRLRELYALDEARRFLGYYENSRLSILRVCRSWQFRWLGAAIRCSVQPLRRSSMQRMENALKLASLAQSIEAFFPGQYSDLSKNQTARHAASSWTQSGHLTGRAKKDPPAGNTHSHGRCHGLISGGYLRLITDMQRFPILGAAFSIWTPTAPRRWA